MSWKYPSTSLLVCSLIAIEPVGATACIRDARLVVCPIGVYSTWPLPVEIERTTTSPVFAPMRASIGLPPSATSLAE
ncbi:MAG TPA: hypothetical protein VMA09_17995 [Candidatus Binataceae bacterium]|nr:hypothetical protein [Candidatus Binataceae bacterium]